MPTDAELERSLRNAVRAALQTPDEVAATVNSLRERVEKQLELDDGFFKRDEWKTRSKTIIQEEFAKDADDEESTSKQNKNGTKRASASSSIQPRKKLKVSKAEEEDEGETTPLSDLPTSSEDEMDFDEPKKKTKSQGGIKNGNKAKASKEEEEDGPTLNSNKITKSKSKTGQEPSKSNLTSTSEKPEIERDDDSSSELSSVIDDLPPPKKSKNASSKNPTSKPSRPSTSKSKTKATSEISPDVEEIKRLQGWLVKCGIRKVWGKELKPYETPKAKIAHLKGMLADAGMTGRYSNDKAAQIKEARELAADIEAVQEGNERWGLGSEQEDDDDDGGRRRSDPKGPETSAGTGRRLVRGAKNYDFLSSDGEETD